MEGRGKEKLCFHFLKSAKCKKVQCTAKCLNSFCRQLQGGLEVALRFVIFYVPQNNFHLISCPYLVFWLFSGCTAGCSQLFILRENEGFSLAWRSHIVTIWMQCEWCVTWPWIGGLPHLETYTWQNLTPTERVPSLPDRVIHLDRSCERDQIKMREYMDRRVTSTTWSPPPPCKEALRRTSNSLYALVG